MGGNRELERYFCLGQGLFVLLLLLAIYRKEQMGEESARNFEGQGMDCRVQWYLVAVASNHHSYHV